METGKEEEYKADDWEEWDDEGIVVSFELSAKKL